MHNKLHNGQINGSQFIVGEANFGGPIHEEGEGKRSVNFPNLRKILKKTAVKKNDKKKHKFHRDQINESCFKSGSGPRGGRR